MVTASGGPNQAIRTYDHHFLMPPGLVIPMLRSNFGCGLIHLLTTNAAVAGMNIMRTRTSGDQAHDSPSPVNQSGKVSSHAGA